MYLCMNMLKGKKMEFEKLYMFNPFTIQNAGSKEIADTYSKLQNELLDEPETGFQ